MNRQEHRRRRRIRGRIGVGILALAAIGGGLGYGLLQDRSTRDAPEPSPSASEELVPLRTTMFSVASTADASRVLAIPALLIAEPITGGHSTALMLDSAMQAVGPASEAPLRQHASGFGPEGLAGAVRNELGLRIDAAVEITEVDLANILERIGPIEVSVAVPIVEDGESVYDAGFHLMDAAELVTFLAFPFDDRKIDAPTRNALVAGAWKQIATAPATKTAIRDSDLAADAAEALRAFATLTTVTPVPVKQLEDGIVLDSVIYEAMVPLLERIWLTDVAPQDRPTVDLRGQTLVEPVLLLVADGIRVERMTVQPVEDFLIEADDQAFGARIERLLGGGRVESPGEPLRTGLGARISYPRAA